MNVDKKIIQKNIFYNTVGSTFYLICQWLMTVFVVRILGYSDAGVLSLAMSVCSIFYMVALYGMRNFQISDKENKYKDGTYVISRIITSIIAILLCYIFVFANSYTIYQKGCIMVFMILKITEAIFDVYQGIAYKTWRLDVSCRSLIARGFISVVIFSIILNLSQSLLISIIGISIGSAAVIGLYDIPKSNKIFNLDYHWDLNKVIMLLKECIPLVIFEFLLSVITFIPRYFLERDFGTEMLGIYASISSPTLIIQVISTLIFTPLYSIFYEKYHKGYIDEFKKLLNRSIVMIFALTVIALIGGKIFGKIGLTILYGKDILKYEYLLSPIIMCTIFTASVWLISGIVTVMRELKKIAIITIISTILCFVVSKYFVSRFYMNGVSYAYCFSLGFIIISLYIVCITLLNKRRKDKK